MFTGLEINGFRGFQGLTVGPLALVNLIAGRNNVGKSSLLEAVFILAGANSPEVAFRVNAFRGLSVVSPDSDEMWGWLFHRKATHQDILISLTDENGQKKAVKLRLAEPTSATVEPIAARGEVQASLQAASTSSVKRDLVYEWRSADGQAKTSRVHVNGKGLRLEGIEATASIPAFYLSSGNRNAGENAERFTKLDTQNRSCEVLSVLQVVEPSLRRLSVRVIGDTAVIQGDVGLGELMPLQFMGDGMVRLLSMVLGILTLPPGGIALVDEVENGIHHSAMLKVWLALATAARKASVQIFATTHSHECIEAAHRAFEESGKYDLRVHRLERVAGQVRAVTSDQTTLATALDQEWEVR